MDPGDAAAAAAAGAAGAAGAVPAAGGAAVGGAVPAAGGGAPAAGGGVPAAGGGVPAAGAAGGVPPVPPVVPPAPPVGGVAGGAAGGAGGIPAPPVHPVGGLGAGPPPPPAGGLGAGPPPPPPPAAGGGVPLPPPVIRNYVDYFRTADRDPDRGDYTDVSTDYAVAMGGNSRYGPAALGQRAAAASVHQIPTAFVQLLRRPAAAGNTAVVQVLLRASTMPVTLRGPAEPWDQQTFAFCGDLVGQQFSLVPLDITAAGAFRLSPANTHTFTDAAMVAHIAATPDGLAPPRQAGDNDAVEVRSRFTTFVPFEFVPLLLPRALSPKQAFTAVFGHAQARNKVNAIRPLLDWLKLAATEAQVGGGESHLLQDFPVLAHPPNAALLSFFARKLDTDLPDWRGTQAVPTFGAASVVQSIDNLTAEQRATRQEAQAQRAAAERGKTPLQFFGSSTLLMVMRFCNVATADQLPPLWSAFAGAPKAQRVSTLQSAVDNAREVMNLPLAVPVTVALTTKVVTASLAGTNPEDLKSGIHPFLFGLRSADELSAIAENNARFMHLHAGAGTPSLADVQLLSQPDEIRAATTFDRLERSLDTFLPFWAALVGLGHETVNYFTNQRRALSQQAQYLADRFPVQPRLPVHLQRYWQVQLHHWLVAQARSPYRVPFMASDVVAQASMGNTAWVLDLPVSLRPPPVPFPAGTPPAPAGNALPPAGNGPPPAAPRGAANQIQRNANYDLRFQPVRERAGVRSRPVRERCAAAGIALPVTAAGRTRCLPFHIIGQCNSSCGNAADHRTDDVTEQDQQTLLAWAQEHWKTE